MVSKVVYQGVEHPDLGIKEKDGVKGVLVPVNGELTFIPLKDVSINKYPDVFGEFLGLRENITVKVTGKNYSITYDEKQDKFYIERSGEKVELTESIAGSLRIV